MKVRFFLGASFVIIVLIILFKLGSYRSDRLSKEAHSDDSIHENPVFHAEVNSAHAGKLKVRVFYEVLCPDSRYFIVKQLYPAWTKLTAMNLTHLVNIELIPFGKATSRMRNGKYKFDCQHGEEECRLNRIHSCVLQSKGVDFSTKLNMVKCSISSPAYTEECGLHDCEDGDRLLHVNGEMTKEDLGNIGFVPTITVNKSQRNQIELLKNFYAEVIQQLNGN